MKKRMRIMIIALTIVFGGLVGFNLFKSVMIKRFFAHYEAPAVTVSSVVAKKEPWQSHIPAVGNFLAINGVDVSAQLGGSVVKIHFNSGEYIEKDRPLIDIDDTVDQANLKFNQADLALQETNYKRQTDLLKRNATASSSVDEAKARLLKAQANVEKTQALINQKHLVAPFSGLLGIRQINLGQYIQPGETKIVTLQSLDPLFLEFYLPEQRIGQLKINQPIMFTVEQNPGISFTGKITAINSKIDTNTHTIQVQATVPNCSREALQDIDDSDLLTKKMDKNGKTIVTCDSSLNKKNNITQFNFTPGMFASIEVQRPLLQNRIVVPTSAISYTLYGNSIFVINDEGKKDSNGQKILTVKRKFITTGDQQGNYTVIKKGLKEGELIVATGELKLQDGTRVVINNSVTLPDIANPDQLGQ